MSEEQIKVVAYELCYDMRRQSNFDQKGHALGGGGNVKVVGVKGERKEIVDSPDGRWLSVCPLVFADGHLAFCAFVLQGKLVMEAAYEDVSPLVSPVTAPRTPRRGSRRCRARSSRRWASKARSRPRP